MDKQLIIDETLCKSCQYCVAACPKNALSIGKRTNKAGYHYVVVDKEKCIACGICYIACPDYVFTIAK